MFVALLGWLAHTALHIWVTVYLRQFKLDAEDNLLARKHVTQTRILGRVAGNVMEVRILLSSSNSCRNFDLRCEVREKIMAFLQREHPLGLPRLRAEFASAGADPAPSTAPS